MTMTKSTRPLVDPAFVELMGRELLANARKGDWREWRPEASEAVSEMRHHVNKLARSLARGDRAGVSEYTADVANLSMMVWRLFGEGP